MCGDCIFDEISVSLARCATGMKVMREPHYIPHTIFKTIRLKLYASKGTQHMLAEVCGSEIVSLYGWMLCGRQLMGGSPNWERVNLQK